MPLKNKNIILGITAGIAAYKTGDLVRLLQKNGANVKVILTDNAKKFVSELSLATLSKNKVYIDQFDYKNYDIEHIALTNWADMILVAPLTANTLSKITYGICDNLLTTTICAFNKKILLAPAMNTNMWNNKIIQSNVKKLKNMGYAFVGPEYGNLACGVDGVGRMSKLDDIVNKVEDVLSKND